MSFIFINPNLVVQKNDPLTTGIVYMPVGMAYAAGTAQQAGLTVNVIDSYGLAPFRVRSQGKFWFFGLDDASVVQRLPADARAIFVYAINLTSHLSTVGLVRAVKAAYPKIPVVVLENPHSVTAYALRQTDAVFYEAGADYILTGPYEDVLPDLLRSLSSDDKADDAIRRCSGMGGRDFFNPAVFGAGTECKKYPHPAWELFPLKNYWSLHFAHGPLTQSKYLPILSSRGCPFNCRFCVTPATTQRHWQGRSPREVVDEMEHWQKTLQVSEFHFEDLNPTVSEERIKGICQEILGRDLKITFKIVSGTKAETLSSQDTLKLMHQAGCRYISVSPETGSPRVLKAMGKTVDMPHILRLIKNMDSLGIRSQACFVLGFPGETDEDRDLTRQAVIDVIKSGVDEIAVFIITPVPGADIFKELDGYNSLSDLNFTPVWRADYAILSAFRRRLYRMFLLKKLLLFPVKFLRQPWRFIIRRFETKMEMVPYRALVLFGLGIFAKEQKK